MAEKTATFAINIPTLTNAKESAGSIDSLKASISSSQDSIKALSSHLRLLRGSSDEVKKAKESLKASIDAEKSSVSANAVALGKLGVVYTAVKKNTTEAEGATERFKKSAGEISGALGGATSKAEAFGDAIKASIANPEIAAIAVTLALGGAIVGLGASLISSAVEVAKFEFESLNAMRTMGLFREAALGSAENSSHFGNQIEAMRGKVATSREELNKLATDLSRDLAQARVSGAGIVDVFGAVAQESAAMGDTAGKKIEDLLTRMKLVGRVGIGRFELQGTGLEFQDVAAQLAKNTGKSLARARQELMFGRASIDQAAKAIRDTIETRFSGINQKRLLDFNVIVQRTKENLSGLGKDVDLTKLLEGANQVAKFFDSSTVSGQIIKAQLENFGKVISGIIDGPLKTMPDAFQRVLNVGLKIEVMSLAVAVGFKGWYTHLSETEKKIIDMLNPLLTAERLVNKVFNAAFAGKGHADTGKQVTAGVAEGMLAGSSKVDAASKHLADRVVGKTKMNLDIHSPSKRAEREIGVEFPRGVAKGIERDTGKVDTAVRVMADRSVGNVPRIGATASTSARSGNQEIHVTMHFHGKTDEIELQRAVSSAEFRAALTKAVEDLATEEGATRDGSVEAA